MRKIIFVTVFWGPEYSFLYANFSLPALLAPGNLPAMKEVVPLEYWIYTDRANADRLEKVPAFARLRDLAEVKFTFIEDSTLSDCVTQEHCYTLMASAHRHAVAKAWEQDFGLCFHDPDRILANGSFSTIADRISAGWRAVMGNGLSVVSETCCPRLVELSRDGTGHSSLLDGQLILEPRQAVRLAVEHLHDHSAVQMVDSDRFTVWPAVMFWPLEGHGYLCRSWHHIPLFVHPGRDGSDFKTSIDGDFVGQVVGLEDCSYLEESDEFMLIEPVRLARRRNHPPGFNALRAFDVMYWAMGNTNEMNREFARHTLWMHDGAVIDRAKAAAVADALMDEVFGLMAQVAAFESHRDQGFADLLGSPLPRMS
jgi:hypothetical protein